MGLKLKLGINAGGGGGIRYLALKPSIPAGESTIFSSLPIPLILGDAKTIYLRKNTGKDNRREMGTYGWGSRWESSREYLRRFERFEREGVGVLWVLECFSKKWEEVPLKILYIREKLNGLTPAQRSGENISRWSGAPPLDRKDMEPLNAIISASWVAKCL